MGDCVEHPRMSAPETSWGGLILAFHLTDSENEVQGRRDAMWDQTGHQLSKGGFVFYVEARSPKVPSAYPPCLPHTGTAQPSCPVASSIPIPIYWLSWVLTSHDCPTASYTVPWPGGDTAAVHAQGTAASPANCGNGQWRRVVLSDVSCVTLDKVHFLLEPGFSYFQKWNRYIETTSSGGHDDAMK